jgi:hypothetical protein
MKLLAMLILLITFEARAALIATYGLNYSSQVDTTSTNGFNQGRTFHKGFFGGSINGAKTLYFGWSINSWGSELKPATGDRSTYSLLEMGPKIIWFANDNYNLYFSAEWNPYTRGERTIGGQKREVLSGNSMSAGIGYRFRLSRLVGLGAGIHYHAFEPGEENVAGATTKSGDKFSNIMPMLELSLITR